MAAACGNMATVTDYDKDVAKRANVVREGLSNAPQQSQTGFGTALRCMDFLMVTYGVQGLGVLIEDIPDATRKVSASGKDMIISAISRMTRRSRAIRLVAFSVTDATLASVIGMHSKAQVLENPPDFTIRGSVSQFDDSLVRKQGDVGIGIGAVTAGAAAQGQASNLALDLSVINTRSLELLPGVTSSNEVLIMKQGAGGDGEVNTRKFGLNFNFVLAKSEGNAQALRTLSELATIELIGKLTKVPYWSCLGTDDTNPQVQAEITDWWETLASDPVSLVAYLQRQMWARGLYNSPVNGQIDDALLHAIKIYQEAMGRKSNPELDLGFFQAYLRTDHTEVQKIARAALAKDPGPAAAPVATASVAPGGTSAPAPNGTPLVFVQSNRGPNAVYRGGQPYAVDVAVDSDTFLYCYLVDENRRINQFFPNPVQTEPSVKAGTRIQFPGNLPFTFVASASAAQETVACFASPKNLGESPLQGPRRPAAWMNWPIPCARWPGRKSAWESTMSKSSKFIPPLLAAALASSGAWAGIEEKPAATKPTNIESMARVPDRSVEQSVLRCFQEGRLVYEGRGYRPVEVSDTKPLLKGGQGKALQLFDMRHGLCILDHHE
ncbi:MAG: DUF4384 domain-containing protein [Burkholderiaceae bacterium]